MIFDLLISNGMVHIGNDFQKADVGVIGEKTPISVIVLEQRPVGSSTPTANMSFRE